jgi:3-oxoacyl-[acyl-carrier protein] reductase
MEKVTGTLPERTAQKFEHLVCDLADPSQVQELAARVKSTLLHLDVILNNAAVQGPVGPLWDNELSLWRQTIEIDLLAPVALCRALVPWMKETGGGSIVNLSGGGATGPRANFSAYATAKAGLVRFSETLAEETRAIGIRVNCIAPGAMKTAMLNEVLAHGASRAGRREFELATRVFDEGGASMRRVAELALFLASDAGSGITGKLVSAIWDDWERWPEHLAELSSSDVYTLRRIVGRDRGCAWGDK